MKNFSIRRKLTELAKQSDQDFCRIWGRNALGKPSGLVVDLQEGEGGGEESILRALEPVSVDDIEALSVVDPDTFALLPATNDGQEEPFGVMLCDVYKFKDGELTKAQTGAKVRRPVELCSGVRGSGVELFYRTNTPRRHRSDELGLVTPQFRDAMTPSLPRTTQEALFNLGKEKTQRESTDCKSMPALRSTI